MTAACARRRDTLVLRAVRAAGPVHVDQLPRGPSVTPRAGSAAANRELGDSSVMNVPLATGDSRSGAVGVSMAGGRWQEGGGHHHHSHVDPALSPQAASAQGATVTPIQAAAPVPQGSVGSAVTPAASSTRCPCQAVPAAQVSTAKVRGPCVSLSSPRPASCAWEQCGSQSCTHLVASLGLGAPEHPTFPEDPVPICRDP